MRVKVAIHHEIEVEVNSTALEQVDQFWRNTPQTNWNAMPSDLLLKATQDVEAVTGLPFGDSQAKETIYAVYAEDGEPILEW